LQFIFDIKRLKQNRKIDIVVVDDTDSNRLLLSRMLSDEGYAVQDAENGKSALELIRRVNPSLILLDALMPGMDGFEVCTALKADVETKNIPVLFISAVDSFESRIKGFSVGGIDFITKPIQPEEVLARIKTHLQLSRLQNELIERNLELEREIGLRQKTEKALFENEFFFKESQKAANIGSYKFNIDNESWYTSEVLNQLFGFEKPGPLTIHDWKAAIHPDEKESVLKYFYQEVVIKGNPFDKEYRIIRQNDGMVRWVYESGRIIQEPQTGTKYLFGTIQDTTNRKSIELKQLQLQQIIQDSLNEIYIFNAETLKFEFINRCAINNLGYDAKELENLTPVDIKPDFDLQSFTEMIRPLRSGDREKLVFISRHKRKNGSIYPVEVHLQVHTQGERQFFVAIINDITERLNDQEALLNSMRYYKDLIDGMNETIWIVDFEGNLVDVNKQAVEVMGYSKEELLSIGLEGIDTTLDQEKIKQLARSMPKDKLQIFQTTHRTKSGRIIPVEIYSSIVNFQGKESILSIARDITEQNQALETLENERTRLRTLIDHLPDAIYIKDREGRKVVANQFDINNIGCAEEKDVIGKTDLELFEGEIGLRGYLDDMNVIHKGQPVLNREENFFNENGEETWLLTTKLPLPDQKGLIIGLVGIGRDITQNKRAIHTIENERKLLRTLIDNLPYAIYVKDAKGRKLVANAADLKLMNCQKEEDIIGKTDLEIFNSIEGRKGFDEDMQVLESGIPMLNMENQYTDSSGKLNWRVISKIPLVDRQGKITGLVGFGRDITEQRTAIETIHKLSIAIEQSPSSIIITDVQNTIEYVNPKFTEISGYQSSEVVGQNIRMLKSGELSADQYKEMWDTIHSEGIWRGELHNRKKNGELYWEWATITSLKNEKGLTTNYIAIKEDINLQKQMEVELIKAKEKAEENDRLKSAFLANMSHEIRTPLNCILGFAELLNDEDISHEQQLEFAHLIETSGNNLLTIINDILDISKIEAGQVELKKAFFPVAKMIKNIHKEFEHKAIQHGITLKLAVNLPDKELLIESDEAKIRQVLVNFVGNALKFTEKGHIEIGCKISGDFLYFYVKDTGIGIKGQYHEHLFDRFRQVENTPTRKYGGNGLGLAISKNLIELLGGSIGLESAPGKGSTFYFTLPYPTD